MSFQPLINKSVAKATGRSALSVFSPPGNQLPPPPPTPLLEETAFHTKLKKKKEINYM